MAQSGFTPISLYFSATSAAVPSAGNLVAGELALNTNDGKLYYKNSSGVVTLLAGATSGPAGGSTTQVQYNNAGVLAGITGATTNGTALTLVAPVLGTPASGTVTNLTGTASININGTVGATTPAAGAFTTGVFASALGSGKHTITHNVTGVSLGEFYNLSADGYGLYIQGGGTGTSKYILSLNDSAANNKFSITGAGAATLTGTLAVTGTLSATGTSTLAAVNASGIFTGTGGANIFTSSNSGAANSLTIKNTSNTSGADAVLKASVNSSAGGDPYLLIDTPAIVGWYVGSDTSNSSRFIIGTDVPGAADKLLITTAGAVSIPGTLAVTGALSATGAITANTGILVPAGSSFPVNAYGATTGSSFFAIANSGGTSYFGVETSAGGTYSGSTAYSTILGSSGAQALQLITNGVVRTTIDSSGNVGIGTTTPDYSLVIEGSTPVIGLTNTASSNKRWLLRGTGNDLAFNEFGTGDQVTFKAGGNVGIGTTGPNYKLEISTDSAGKPGVGGLWTVVSDERIKSNIVPANLDRCYEIVKSVPLKHFGFAPGVYTDDQIQDKHNLGWIAQDVQKVFKNAVSVKPFTLKTDIPDGTEDYEEQDFTLDAVEKTETSIQVINGKPVQVSKVVTSENKVMLFDTVAVLDEAGAAVMEDYEVTPAIPAIEAKDEAKAVAAVPAVMGTRPVTYQMPRMITKTRPKVRHDVIEDCLDLNSGQMIAALYGCVQALIAKVEALEAK